MGGRRGLGIDDRKDESLQSRPSTVVREIGHPRRTGARPVPHESTAATDLGVLFPLMFEPIPYLGAIPAVFDAQLIHGTGPHRDKAAVRAEASAVLLWE